MAISKRTRAHSIEPPEAAAFIKILDEDLATPAAVHAAYMQALRAWSAANGPIDDDGSWIVPDRPVVEPSNSPEARLIRIGRVVTFTSGANTTYKGEA